jgi:protein phosphatase 1 regulatory subunit 37
MNEILKELFIGDNKFMPTDGVQIGNLLKYNHKLELLDLRNNHLQVKLCLFFQTCPLF